MEGYKSTGPALWKETSNNCEPGANPYVAGLKILAEKTIERPRKIYKEISKAPFCSTIPPDQWKNTLVNTNSIRSMKSIQASLNALGVGFSKSLSKLPYINKINIEIENDEDDARDDLPSLKNSVSHSKLPSVVNKKEEDPIRA